MTRVVLLIYSVITLMSCVSVDSSQNNKPQPPAITAEMPLEQAIDAAIQFGGQTLERVKKLIEKRHQWPETKTIVIQKIEKNNSSHLHGPFVNTIHLYQASTQVLDLNIFQTLISSEHQLARQLGWQLAANLPSDKIAQAIENIFSEAIRKGEEKDYLLPQMANAIRSNRLITGYTMVRQGLMETGQDEFALALAVLDPGRASDDFLDYLALAPVEELRQLNQKTVNQYACLIILKHLINYPAKLNHPHFDHLFLYSVSRNQALAELASLALEAHLPQYQEHLAFILARLPAWIQIAFIEGVQRTKNNSFKRLLSDLRRVSSQNDVIEEIDQMTW